MFLTIQVLRTIEQLGSHSISPFELKSLIGLLQLGNSGSDGESPFPYKSHVIHVISSIAKGSGFSVCRDYFDIPIDGRGITVPNLRSWSGPTHGFSFHCWLRLDNFPTGGGGGGRVRRQLYSIYSAGGNGFEAFVTPEGTTVLYTPK